MPAAYCTLQSDGNSTFSTPGVGRPSVRMYAKRNWGSGEIAKFRKVQWSFKSWKTSSDEQVEAASKSCLQGGTLTAK